MREVIKKYSKYDRPKFVGIRYLLVWDEENYLTREDVHQGYINNLLFLFIEFQFVRTKDIVISWFDI